MAMAKWAMLILLMRQPTYYWIIEGIDGLDEGKIRHMNAFYALLKKWIRGKEYTSVLLTKADYDARVNFLLRVKERDIQLACYLIENMWIRTKSDISTQTNLTTSKPSLNTFLLTATEEDEL